LTGDAGSLEAMPFTLHLRDAVGGRLFVHPQECERYAVGGAVPKAVASPRDAAQAARALLAIASEGGVCAIRGTGSKSNWAPPAQQLDAVLETSAMSDVIEYAPGDLTVTAQAGIRLAELQARLARHGQFFPCDAPFAQTATLGGTLAANANGPLRQRFGALRDLALGMRLVLSDGTIAFSGAKVVKSVAGYDAHKLFVGSRGTLGLIAEVTLKVAPMPPCERGLSAGFASVQAACDAALRISRSDVFPFAITLHDARSAVRAALPVAHPPPAWLLAIRCGGTQRAVARQIDELRSACAQAGAATLGELDAAILQRAWAGIRELYGGAHYPSGDYAVCKVVGLPTETPAILSAVRRAWPEAETSAQPAAGIVYAHVPAAALAAVQTPAAAQALQELWHQCSARDWSAEYVSLPPAAAAVSAPPLETSLPLALMRRVKAALDPADVLDPGRFLGGLGR
jgi:glycolate oxidase FAD binding subunit